jgi:hypothetical protein
MFERFTERARKVIVLAQSEAERLRHNYIGTEHLLLGLIHEGEGVAAQALTASGVTLDGAREQVENIVGHGEADISQKPFTPGSKRVLESSLKEAMRLGHNYIGTEHVLLGLVRESEGVAARVLSNLDIDSDAVRREVIMRLPEAGREVGSLDEVEREVEQGQHRTLFRGRVGGIRATAAPLGVLIVDVDYSYRLWGDPAVTLATIDPEDVESVTRAHLKVTRIDTLEGAVEVAGTHLMVTFGPVVEITVSVTTTPEPVDPLAPTFSVSATFRR